MGVKDFTQVCGAEYRIIFNTYVKDKHWFVNTSHKALRMLSECKILSINLSKRTEPDSRVIAKLLT